MTRRLTLTCFVLVFDTTSKMLIFVLFTSTLMYEVFRVSRDHLLVPNQRCVYDLQVGRRAGGPAVLKTRNKHERL